MDIGDLKSREDGIGDRDYRLQVTDFGPIAHADVEFRPLTVFLGPSNTGKSYLATLSYALHRYFATENERYWYHFQRLMHSSDRKPDELPVSEIRAELEAWTAAVTEDGDLPRLPSRVIEVVRREIEKGARMADPLHKEIVRTFGTDRIQELIRRSGSGMAEVVVALPGSADRASLRYRVRVSEDRFDLEGEVSGSFDPLPEVASPMAARWGHLLRREALRYQTSLESDRKVDDRSRSLHTNRLLRQVVEVARQPMVAPLNRPAYYLPADRTGIMHSHKMVVGALVQSAATAGLRRSPDVPMLSGVLTDFLEELIRMGDRTGSKRGRRINGRIASRLEEAVLGGAVRVESSETNYPQFLYRPQGWTSDLALMRSSSMVSELAPLVLYLRHVVGRGDVLVIEEPESHLHPAMQVEVIQWVARIVRAGVRVILTTHSEWVVDGLANIVQASRIAVGGGSPIGSAAPVLHPREVGAWRFTPGEATNGVMVEEAEIDGEGMYPSGFDKVAVDLHNRWADIESRMSDSD